MATLLLGALEPKTEHGTTDGIQDIARADAPPLRNPLRVVLVSPAVIIAPLAVPR
ncbi:MAG: hypothetical protein ACYSWQ_26970 [Planctomycetota bacterium]|jgi:hypothetical protein